MYGPKNRMPVSRANSERLLVALVRFGRAPKGERYLTQDRQQNGVIPASAKTVREGQRPLQDRFAFLVSRAEGQ